MGVAHVVLGSAATSGRHLRWEICARAVGLNQKDAENRLKGGPRSTRLCFRRFRSDGCRWRPQNGGTGCCRQPACSILWNSWHRDRKCISCRQLAAGAAQRSLLNADGRVRRVAHCHLLHSWHRKPAGRQSSHRRYEHCDRQCNRYEFGSPCHNYPQPTQRPRPLL